MVLFSFFIRPTPLEVQVENLKQERQRRKSEQTEVRRSPEQEQERQRKRSEQTQMNLSPVFKRVMLRTDDSFHDFEPQSHCFCRTDR